ncbi:hypothetical protein BGZ65_004716 [Modicella reniformis]|uniref:C2H2-type domain-containing protein n=1 Tax=Modicella reniformis TaxID=1440133 RepID=A0A9P6IKR1_9FUNG|nr:hypothetical protein BGZ65_004716 [Modicella reniformis]
MPEYECIICDKFFKSEQQWKKHERSKRHLKAVEEIRLEHMGQSPDEDVSTSPEDSDDQDQNGEEEKKKKRKRRSLKCLRGNPSQ